MTGADALLRLAFRRGAHIIADYVAASELRNRLVHEYPLDEDEQAQRVNASWTGFPAPIRMVDALRRHMERRGFDFDDN